MAEVPSLVQSRFDRRCDEARCREIVLCTRAAIGAVTKLRAAQEWESLREVPRWQMVEGPFFFGACKMRHLSSVNVCSVCRDATLWRKSQILCTHAATGAVSKLSAAQ